MSERSRGNCLRLAAACLLLFGCAANPPRPQLVCPQIEPMPAWAVEDLCRLTGITDPPCGNASSSSGGQKSTGIR